MYNDHTLQVAEVVTDPLNETHSHVVVNVMSNTNIHTVSSTGMIIAEIVNDEEMDNRDQHIVPLEIVDAIEVASPPNHHYPPLDASFFHTQISTNERVLHYIQQNNIIMNNDDIEILLLFLSLRKKLLTIYIAVVFAHILYTCINPINSILFYLLILNIYTIIKPSNELFKICIIVNLLCKLLIVGINIFVTYNIYAIYMFLSVYSVTFISMIIYLSVLYISSFFIIVMYIYSVYFIQKLHIIYNQLSISQLEMLYYN